MSRATEELLDLVHGLTFQALKDELERAAYRASLPKTHEDYAPVNPQLIDKALKALKDNGVDSPAKSARVDNLAAQLSDLDLDDEAVRLRPN